MKINYLLYSVAFASAFAACSDELAEVANAPVNEAVAGRPSAGNVVLSINNGTQTRLNDAGTGFEEGDKVKLFLMDELNINTLNNGGEEWNANFTPWKNQDTWFTMYDMQDYISSNYIYVKEGSDFVNKSAQLVEGNYVAFYQEDESYRSHEITNRQDLWAYINPKVTLTQKSANVYANMENDIYLDYQQVYRNDDADPDGKLTMPMELKPVMNRVHFVIGNLNNAQYRIRRIAIKRTDDEAVSNIAYIRPASKLTGSTYPDGWNDEVMNDNGYYGTGTFADYEAAIAAITNPVEKAVAEAEFANKFTKTTVTVDYAGNTEDIYTYNGGKTAFTQADARAITFFETTANGHVPYGLKSELTAPAYEYAVEFPGEGHILNAHAPFTSTERVDAYFAIPVFADEFAAGDYEIIVEGDYRDITEGLANNPGGWKSGYWSQPVPLTPNSKWKMQKAFDYDWTMAQGTSWPTGSLTVDFNDMILYAEENAGGVSTHSVRSYEEFLNVLVEDGKAGVQTSQIEINAIGMKFDQAIADQIKANAAAYQLTHPLPALQYSVDFSFNANYTVEGDMESSDESFNYGEATYADCWRFYENNAFNMNTLFIVTVKDVFDLPTDIAGYSALYLAPQTIKEDITFYDKTIFTSASPVTVEDGVTVDGQYWVVLLDGTEVNLNETGSLKNIYVLQPNAVVTVLATGAKTAVITGENRGKVVMPRTDVHYFDTVTGDEIEVGINDVVDHSGLTNYNAVKSFPAALCAGKKVDTSADYSISNLKHDKDYVIVNSDPIAVDGGVNVFAPVPDGFAPAN